MSGTVRLGIQGDDDAIAGVYIGSDLADLQLVATTQDTSSSGPGMLVDEPLQLQFEAIADTVYHITLQGNRDEYSLTMFLDCRRLQLAPPQTDGSVSGQFQTTFNLQWKVETSKDMQTWRQVQSGWPVEGTLQFDDPLGTPGDWQFYRATSAEQSLEP